MIHYEEEQWHYYNCNTEKMLYYECIAKDFEKVDLKWCPKKCKPIQFSALLNSINSTLPKCATYEENMSCFESFIDYYFTQNTTCQRWCSGTQFVGKRLDMEYWQPRREGQNNLG